MLDIAPTLAKGDKIACMLKTRDGGRMFLFDADVRKVGNDEIEVETPGGVRDMDVKDVVWSGKRFEMFADDNREAPRKRGGVKRGQ